MTHSFGPSAHWGGAHPALRWISAPGCSALSVRMSSVHVDKGSTFPNSPPTVLVQQTHNSKPHFFVETLQIPKHCLLDIFFF